MTDREIPREFFPFGRKMIPPFKCKECGGDLYCVGLICYCEEHKEDFVYDELTDCLSFFCKPCYTVCEVPIGKYSEIIKELK